MCDTISQLASNLLADARGVLERNRDRWPAADWQTLDAFVSRVEELNEHRKPHVHIAIGGY